MPEDARVKPRIGATARRTRTVTVRDIELFTELTGDRNPLHYDELRHRGAENGVAAICGGGGQGEAILLRAV
jgi:acyl dehydratase